MRLPDLLRRFSAPAFDAPLAPDRPFAAIGDIHGCDDLVARLLDRLDRDLSLVFVGDYVDRGDDSAGVLRRLHRLHRLDGEPRVTCLMGNHEQMLLDALDMPETAMPRWLQHGGLQTVASFGVGDVPDRSDTAGLAAFADRLRDAMGDDLLTWLRARPLSWKNGNVAVVHAGAAPDVSLDDQSPDTLIWGHPEFGRRARTDALWVVHGHTIVDAATARDGVVSIDTGAYATGRLTAAVVRPNDVSFVTA
ncbi:metallophosphoesterase [Roseivivax marinus]|uniref:metallophosphoesterase n=1 Tax=Roseivivax marinus TaxID=1379903 RepID=UPI00273EAC6A|nr:metallophosphoesterase [Roseivivax marinus]